MKVFVYTCLYVPQEDYTELHSQKVFTSEADAINHLKHETGRYIAEYDMNGECDRVRVIYENEASRRLVYEEDDAEVLMMVNELEVDL